MRIGNLQGTRFTAGLPDVRRAIATLPGFPAVANAATIAAKLRGLAEVEAQGPVTGERLSMLALGMFLFGLDTLAYQELQRRSDWRHGASELLGAMPAWQYLGPGADTISLPGVLVPEFAGSITALDQLREMAATGDAWPLVESGGRVLGQFIIRSVDERRTNFLAGGTARRIEFGIELEKVAI